MRIVLVLIIGILLFGVPAAWGESDLGELVGSFSPTDSSIIAAFEYCSDGFKPLDESENNESRSVRRMARSVKYSLERGELSHIRLNRYHNEYLSSPEFLENPKYRAVDKGILVVGQRLYITDIISREPPKRYIDLYFIPFIGQARLLKTAVIESQLPVILDIVKVDTTTLSYTFPQIEQVAGNTTAPAFIDGNRGLSDFVDRTFVYSAIDHEFKMSGRQVVSFTIEVDGSVTNAQIIHGVTLSLDKELIRVVKMTTRKWIPGTLGGEAVPVEVMMTVNSEIRELQ